MKAGASLVWVPLRKVGKHRSESVERTIYQVVPNNSRVNLAWPTESPFSSHLTLPFLTMSIASIRANTE